MLWCKGDGSSCSSWCLKALLFVAIYTMLMILVSRVSHCSPLLMVSTPLASSPSTASPLGKCSILGDFQILWQYFCYCNLLVSKSPTIALQDPNIDSCWWTWHKTRSWFRTRLCSSWTGQRQVYMFVQLCFYACLLLICMPLLLSGSTMQWQDPPYQSLILSYHQHHCNLTFNLICIFLVINWFWRSSCLSTSRRS